MKNESQEGNATKDQPMTETTTQVERVALAILNSDRVTQGLTPLPSRDNVVDSEGYVRNATAAIKAMSDAEPVDDDSLGAMIGELGNQIHNLGCEYQNHEGLRDRLEGLRTEAWRLARLAPLYAAPQPRTAPIPHEVAPQGRDEVERLREALRKCGEQFHLYATEHKAKSDAAYKAWDEARYWGNTDEQTAAHKEYHKRLTQTQTNEAMVAMIDAALSPPLS